MAKFELTQNALITMELDMTQQKSEHGILSMNAHSNAIDGVDINKYSNILFDNIEIDKKWRAAVALYKHNTDIVSLLPWTHIP